MKRIEELMKNIFEQRKFLRLIEEETLTHVDVHTLLNTQDAQDLSTALSVSNSITHFIYAVDDYDSSANSINQRNTIISSGLTNNTSIKHLDLHKNFTGSPWTIFQQPQDKPNYDFPNMLKVNHSLVYIDLSNNGFADKYAQLIGEGLKGNKVIKHLNLSNNIFTGAGIEKICLALQYCAAEYGGLKYLNLSLNPLGIQGAINLQPLLESTNSIQYLNLAQGQFTTGGNNMLFNSLANNKSVTSLDFSKNGINSDGAKFLSSMLIGNSTLKELFLEGNNIGVEGYKVLNESLRINKYITTLNLKQNYSYNNVESDILSDYLKTNNTIKSLNISTNQFTSPEGLKKVMTSLGDNTSLISIDFSNCYFGQAGAMLLSKQLISKKLLKKLDLSYNNLKDEGMVMLAKGLKFTETVTHLNISHNNIGELGGEAAFCALGKIKYLNISFNNLNANFMKSIAVTLKDDKALISLDISNNPSISSGITTLLEALENNFTLTDLNISGTGIGLNNNAIFTQLKKNFSIASIKLNGNSAGVGDHPNTTNCLADLIKSHPSIVSIELKSSVSPSSQGQLTALINESNTFVHCLMNEPHTPGSDANFINKIVTNRMNFQKNLLELNHDPKKYLENQKDSASFNLFILVKQICALGNQKFLPQELASKDTSLLTPKVKDCFLNVSKLVMQLKENNVDDSYSKILSQMDLIGLAEYFEDTI